MSSTRRASVLLLWAVSVFAACEKVGPSTTRDAGHRRADAAMLPPDAAPVPDASIVVVDAAPPARDASPRPAPRPQRLDGCDTDDDCTTYGDPCGRGIFPVNRLYEERAHAAAQKKCPGASMAYLTAVGATKTRCVRNRCRMASELGPGDD